MRPGILVTGGAGYIGSHVVLKLVAAGHRVVVLDDLSSGFRDAVIGAPLVVGDCGDADCVRAVLREYGVRTLVHFAARTIVPESVADPLRYYAGNTCATRCLLAECTAAGVRHVVFSSTAAVYGIPQDGSDKKKDGNEPKNPEQPSLEAVLERRALASLDLDLRESALDKSLQDLRSLELQIKTERERLDLWKQSFDNRIASLESGRTEQAIVELQQAIEAMQPKQAKDQLLQILNSPPKSRG